MRAATAARPSGGRRGAAARWRRGAPTAEDSWCVASSCAWRPCRPGDISTGGYSLGISTVVVTVAAWEDNHGDEIISVTKSGQWKTDNNLGRTCDNYNQQVIISSLVISSAIVEATIMTMADGVWPSTRFITIAHTFYHGPPSAVNQPFNHASTLHYTFS